MPITIPAFDQYQSPIVPLRGLWNAAPQEGDKFITAEIDWLVTTRNNAVQFAVSANSPVSFTQIVALAVDNSRSGVDVDFVFSDSGFILTVPAHNQGVFPVFTNGLMFYVIGTGAIVGDVTTFQVLNSMPPPTYIAPSVEQNHVVVPGILTTNGTTQVIPPGVNGTINTLSISLALIAPTAALGTLALSFWDGSSPTRLLWQQWFDVPADGTNTFNVNLTGLSMRFANGVSAVVSNSTVTGNIIVANIYYSQP